MSYRIRFIYKFVVLTLVVITVFCSVYCHSNQQSEIEHLPYLNLSDSAKYVGINTCKQCHQSIYETFIKTGMGQSFDFATHHKSSAVFDKHAIIYDKVLDYYYIPKWKGDSLFITEFRLQGKDTIYKRTEKASYIVGSGQHTNSHIANYNGYLQQLPMTFYTQKGKWDPPPGFENGHNTRFGRIIGLECMSCHNAYPKYVLGSENKFSEVPQGINCERCHGPGSIHVEEKKAGHTVDINKEIDYSIVNPAKLPIDLQFEICQRCHLQGNAVLKDGKSFYDFKPGMHLSEVMDVYMPKFKGNQDEHIMASHVERLKMSKCFIATMKKVDNGTLAIKDKLKPYKDALTCVTCHNPHVSVKITANDVFNAACMKCHNGADNQLCNRKDNNPKQVMAGNCVSCHMPKTGTIDIPNVIATDHYIRKPVAASQLKKLKEFLGIVAINNPKPSQQSIAKGYIQYFDKFDGTTAALDSAKAYLNDKTDADVKENLRNLVYLYYTRKDYKQVTTYAERSGGINAVAKGQKQSWGNEDAWLDYRIGDSYCNNDNLSEGIKYIQFATELSPYILDFKNRLAGIYVSQQKYQEAITLYEWLVKENPRQANVWSNLGYAYLVSSNNMAKAEECYNKSLALNPDYEQALLNKAGLCLFRKQFPQARALLAILLKKHPNNQQALQVMQQIR